MTIDEQMRLFMEPKSVAVVGVSRNTGENSFNTVENLINYGYSGKIYPINPHAEAIHGVRAYSSVRDVSAEIDLAVISTPRSLAVASVEECVEKNIKAIIVITQGFSDADEEGKHLQNRIVRIARKGGARIIGPNSFGVANAFTQFNTAFVPFEMKKTPVAVVCQSGLFFQGLPGLMLTGKAVDLGNCCDIGFAEALQYFETDPETELILLHIEGIREGRQFVEAVRSAAGRKPLIALKTGKSCGGAQAMQSHTGSLAGNDDIYDAALRQCGILRANDTDEIVDIIKAFSHLPPIRGRRVAIATAVYGAAAIAVDACEEYGMELAKFSPRTVDEISALAPSWLKATNPVDLGGLIFSAGLNEVLERVMNALLADPEVDAVLFIGPSGHRDLFGCLDVIPQVAHVFNDKPVVSWLYGPQYHEFATQLEASGKTAVFPTCERAIRALSRLRYLGKSIQIRQGAVE